MFRVQSCSNILVRPSLLLSPTSFGCVCVCVCVCVLFPFLHCTHRYRGARYQVLQLPRTDPWRLELFPMALWRVFITLSFSCLTRDSEVGMLTNLPPLSFLLCALGLTFGH
jgi:hypothetical protein